MSYLMAYGMEVYNVAIRFGTHISAGGFSDLSPIVFLEAAKEASFMGLFVFVFSSLFGNRIGASFAAKRVDPSRDNPYVCMLLRQAGTIAIMCPTMSLVASILFGVVLGGVQLSQLPSLWIGTVIKNYPMAFFWNMFGAAPLTRLLFQLIFQPDKRKAAALNEVSA